MIPLLYITLLILSSLILYKSGKACVFHIDNHYFFYAFIGIVAFTLNVGLRWGRGVDYNLYYYIYNDIVRGLDSGHEYLFQQIIKIFGSLGITWQGFVMFMSFTLIVSIYLFLKNYSKVLPISLALFPIFATSAENLMRWYFGFSFILCGMGVLLMNKDRSVLYFTILSVIGVNLHYGLLPMPFIYYCVWKLNRVLLNPWISILCFLGLGLLFDTNFMLKFADIITVLNLGEHFSGYQSNIEFWLTGGFSGRTVTAFSSISVTLTLMMLTIWGYKLSKMEDKYFRFIFNIYIIGFVTYPICQQIELLDRYNQLFIIFQFIVFAYVLHYLWKKKIKISLKYKLITVIIILNFFRSIVFAPFVGNPNYFLYIWDSKGRHTLDIYKEYIWKLQNNK